MEVKHDQFIGIYENAISHEWCDKVIDYFEKAEKYYLKALKINDKHIGALEYLGELYYETGRLEEAFELLDRLESAAGKNSEEYLELFEILNS